MPAFLFEQKLKIHSRLPSMLKAHEYRKHHIQDEDCKFKIGIFNWNILQIYFLQGMEHNPDVTDDQDVGEYMKRDLLKRKEPAYKIIRDEIVGR